MKVIGKNKGSFKAKDSGNVIAYGRVFVEEPFPEDAKDSEGIQCEILRCKPEIVDTVRVGSVIVPVYNKYGKVDAIMEVNEDGQPILNEKVG
jgi:hypothetical protein